MKRCGECNFVNRQEDVFCEDCGAELPGSSTGTYWASKSTAPLLPVPWPVPPPPLPFALPSGWEPVADHGSVVCVVCNRPNVQTYRCPGPAYCRCEVCANCLRTNGNACPGCGYQHRQMKSSRSNEYNLQHQSRNRALRVNADPHCPIGDMMDVIIQSMKLPRVDNRGVEFIYVLSYQDRFLTHEETLASAGVMDGGTICVIGLTLG